MAAPIPKADEQNPKTVVLDRWPTESEKTKAYRDAIAKIRKGS